MMELKKKADYKVYVKRWEEFRLRKDLVLQKYFNARLKVHTLKKMLVRIMTTKFFHRIIDLIKKKKSIKMIRKMFTKFKHV